MAELQKKSRFSSHLWIIYLLSIILLAVIWYFQWVLGLIMTVLLAVSFYYSIRTERTLQSEAERYITTLSHRIKKVGEEALLEMPFGIILYNEEYKIEWTNPYMNKFSEDENLVGSSLNDLSEDIIPMIKENNEEFWFSVNDYKFMTTVRKDERLLYLFDRTAQSELQQLYRNDQTVLAIIFLDNYEEITQNMDDTHKSQLNSEVTARLNEWSKKHGLYLKRTSQDRVFAVGTEEI